jgi:hypothetical protein
MRAAEGFRRVLDVRAAEGELPALRGEGGGGALGDRQALLEQELHAVSGEVGAAAELARSGDDLPHFLGKGLPLSGRGGKLGFGAPRPDGGVPNRRPLSTRHDGLWVGKERTVKTLLRFFRFFGPARSAQIAFICSDLLKP